VARGNIYYIRKTKCSFCL